MCKLSKELLQEYVDGTINSLEKIVLEEHLANCKECVREINQFKVMEWNLSNLLDVPVPQKLALLRETAIKEVLAEEKNELESSGSDKLATHYQNIMRTTTFIQFIPGVKLLDRAVEKLKKEDKAKPSSSKQQKLLRKIIGI